MVTSPESLAIAPRRVDRYELVRGGESRLSARQGGCSSARTAAGLWALELVRENHTQVSPG
jgi:hypothetical protein